MSEIEEARREVIWRGLDDPDRLDVVSVDFGGRGGFVATGTQSTGSYRARWDLAVDASWRTRMLTVDVEGLGADGQALVDGLPLWQRHLNLWRQDATDGTSSWRAQAGESGDVPRHLGEAGLSPTTSALLVDAVDVDLSGCPLTNTMPIRRLGFLDGRGVQTPLTMAWVSLPDLAVHAASQTYEPSAQGLSEIASALDPVVAGVVHYRSATRGVSVDLSLDGDGIVLTYPDLAARVEVR